MSAPSESTVSLQELIHCPDCLQPASGITSASPGVELVAHARDNLYLLMRR